MAKKEIVLNSYTLALVLARCFTLLLVWGTMTVMTLAILYLPWKLQTYAGDKMEIGVWTICKHSTFDIRCFDNWYSEHPIWWFNLWRVSMVLYIFIQLFAFVYICYCLVRRPVLASKPWITVAFVNFGSGTLLFFTLVLFKMKFEWAWVKMDFGWPIMGWSEETANKDAYQGTAGFPYIMAWVCTVCTFLATFFCFYTRKLEVLFIKEEREKKRTQNLPSA